MAIRRSEPTLVNFGERAFYSGSLGIAEGDYQLNFHTQMFQPTKKDGSATGQPFLAVMIEATPLDADGNPVGEAVEHPLGCGRKAAESFVPSEDGRGFVPVPGATNTSLYGLTNWGMFLTSLYETGMPEGYFTNDVTVLNEIKVHIINVPEPEERKGFRSQTGEAALQGETKQRDRLCPVVSEIKEGAPWEATAAKPKAKVGAASKVAAKPVAKAKPAPEPEPEEEAASGDVAEIAMEAITSVLEKPANANGCTKILLRTQTFAAVTKKHDEETANAVLADVFKTDDTLNALLNDLGYNCEKGSVKLIS